MVEASQHMKQNIAYLYGQTIYSDELANRSDTRANDYWIHPEAKEKGQ